MWKFLYIIQEDQKWTTKNVTQYIYYLKRFGYNLYTFHRHMLVFQKNPNQRTLFYLEQN